MMVLMRSQAQNWHTLAQRKLVRDGWPVSNVQWRCYPGDVKAVAPLGCLVAIVSSNLDAKLDLPSNVKCQVHIYTGGSCATVTSVCWLVRLESLLALQWSDNLLLAAVFYNACVRVFSAQGELMHHFYLFFSEQNPKGTTIDPSIVTLCTWGGGVIYVSKETTCLYVQRGFEAVDCTHFPLGDYALHITSLGIIPHEEWRDSVVILTTVDRTFHTTIGDLLKCRDGDMFQRYIKEIEHVETGLYNDVIVCNHPAPGETSAYFALCNVKTGAVASLKYENGTVELLWHDSFESFKKVYVVGDGVVALERDMGITFTRGSTQTLQFQTSPICISNEIGGGIRVFTAKSVEFYNVVSTSTERVFAQEKCDPAAVLVKTHEIFNRGDVRACETLRTIRDDVVEAAETCLKAAEASWDTATATLLLDTALFGRSMSSTCADSDGYPTSMEPVAGNSQDGMRPNGDEALPTKRDDVAAAGSHLSDTAQMVMPQDGDVTDPCGRFCRAMAMLRVVNAIKEPPCDIRTNISQLLALGSRALVVILAALKCHLMAIRIADFLGVDKRDILLHWVRTRVKLGGYMTDGELVDVITKSLEGYAGVVLPHSDIAEAVAKEKRETLALALLDRERSLLKRFRVLCSWNELRKAAAIAADACSPLYAAHVILEAQNGANMDKLIDIANSNSFVRDVFIKQCLIAGDAKVLQVFYERTNDIMSAAVNAVQQALDFLDPLAAERAEHRTKSSMHQHISRLAIKQNTQAEDCVTWLKFSSGFFGSIAGSKGTHKPAEMESAALWKEFISQQLALLNTQAAFEKSAELKDVSLIGKSLMHTIFVLYRYDMAKEAEVIATKFRVPFNQLWRCRIAASYEVHNTNTLLQMAMDKNAHAAQQATIKSGKGPIDMVIDALLSLGAISAAESVVATLKPPHQQQWNARMNKQSNSSDNPDGSSSILLKISQRLWH